jgi:GNAT superfamily N-acetyltransferase
MNLTTTMEIKVLTGKDVELEARLLEVARLRIQIFREFPYLYDGDLNYEQKYLATYLNCPQSVIVLALDQGQVIGASTGLPLSAETEEFLSPFLAQGYNSQEIFYCGESVLLPAYRGHGIYRYFFQGRENHAKSLDGIKFSYFCAVVRPVDHPRYPANYVPLDAIWQHFGYRKYPELTTSFAWKDLDEAEQSFKTMVFWGKTL